MSVTESRCRVSHVIRTYFIDQCNRSIYTVYTRYVTYLNCSETLTLMVIYYSIPKAATLLRAGLLAF